MGDNEMIGGFGLVTGFWSFNLKHTPLDFQPVYAIPGGHSFIAGPVHHCSYHNCCISALSTTHWPGLRFPMSIDEFKDSVRFLLEAFLHTRRPPAAFYAIYLERANHRVDLRFHNGTLREEFVAHLVSYGFWHLAGPDPANAESEPSHAPAAPTKSILIPIVEQPTALAADAPKVEGTWVKSVAVNVEPGEPIVTHVSVAKATGTAPSFDQLIKDAIPKIDWLDVKADVPSDLSAGPGAVHHALHGALKVPKHHLTDAYFETTNTTTIPSPSDFHKPKTGNAIAEAALLEVLHEDRTSPAASAYAAILIRAAAKIATGSNHTISILPDLISIISSGDSIEGERLEAFRAFILAEKFELDDPPYTRPYLLAHTTYGKVRVEWHVFPAEAETLAPPEPEEPPPFSFIPSDG